MRWKGVAIGVLLCVCLLSTGSSPVAAQATAGEVDVSTLYETDTIDGNQQVRDLVRTEEGGLIALVITSGGRETLVVRLDSSGDVVSEETVSGRLESISRVDTDAYAAAGTRGEVAILTRINEEGWIEWTERYGGDERDVGFDAVSAPHGDTYLLASTESFQNDTEYNSSNLWAVRVDDEGERRWDRLLEYEQSTVFPQGERLNDGSLVITGQIGRELDGDDTDGDTEVAAVRLAPDGDTEWRTEISGVGESEGSERVADVAPAHSNGVVLAGGSNSGNDDEENFDAWAAQLGSDGDVVWQQQYDSDGPTFVSSVVRTADDYLLAGGQIARAGGREVSVRTLSRIDTDGDEQFSTLVPRDRNARETIQAAAWLDDGRLAIGGTSAVGVDSGETQSDGWIDAAESFPEEVDPGPSTWDTQHSDAEQNGEGWTVEDSSADIMLLGATAVSILLLFVPYGGRRLRRWR
ncbi:hypothetical protein EGH24_06925 [Halonotius terrestris]|uniref:Uncharacterized protein n=1 Tax=Halonotius terrestris TaxID=2487750 RepID=A0A8J8TCH3_9EURY|nr:hypothetical protein [Halonotius terrestris]TQQ80886.1 hypothetical protein EGH24_06925 [Halonotius terrestris]